MTTTHIEVGLIMVLPMERHLFLSSYSFSGVERFCFKLELV